MINKGEFWKSEDGIVLIHRIVNKSIEYYYIHGDRRDLYSVRQIVFKVLFERAK